MLTLPSNNWEYSSSLSLFVSLTISLHFRICSWDSSSSLHNSHSNVSYCQNPNSTKTQLNLRLDYILTARSTHPTTTTTQTICCCCSLPQLARAGRLYNYTVADQLAALYYDRLDKCSTHNMTR